MYSPIAVFYLLLAGLCWSFTPSLALMAAAGPWMTTTIRTLSSTVFLVLMLGPPRNAFQELCDASRGMVLISGLAAVACNACYAAAFVLTGTGNVYALFYTFPLLSLLLDWLQGRSKLQLHDFFAIVAGLAGVCITQAENFSLHNVGWGEVLGGITSISWVIHIRASRSTRSPRQGVAALAVGQAFAMLFLGPFSLYIEPLPHFSQIAWLTTLGATSTGALLFWIKGVRRVPGHVAGSLIMLEAPLGVLAVLWIHDLPPTANVALGGLLVILSALIITLQSRKSP